MPKDCQRHQDEHGAQVLAQVRTGPWRPIIAKGVPHIEAPEVKLHVPLVVL